MAARFARTARAAAKLLKITERQFHRWVGEPWFPKGANTSRGWSLSLISKARDEHGKKGSVDSIEESKLRSAERRAKIDQLRTAQKLKQLELDEAAGELLRRETVEPQMALLFQSSITFHKQLPSLLEHYIPAEHAGELHRGLKIECDEFHTRLRAELMRVAAELGQDLDI